MIQLPVNAVLPFIGRDPEVATPVPATSIVCPIRPRYFNKSASAGSDCEKRKRYPTDSACFGWTR
jgi:hypothetical protein